MLVSRGQEFNRAWVNPNNLIYPPREAPTKNTVLWNLTILIWTPGWKGGGNRAEKTFPGGYHYTVTTVTGSQVPVLSKSLTHLISLNPPSNLLWVLILLPLF